MPLPPAPAPPAPAPPAPAPPAPAPPCPINYADLGDSYASGVNTPDQGPKPCYRSDQAFGEQWATKKGVPANARTFDACSGDTTSDVVEKQLSHLSPSTTLVSVVAGGDDLDFGDVMSTCVLSTDDACTSMINTEEASARNTLPGKLDAMFKAIHDHAPNAKVIALGYPLLYDRTVETCLTTVTVTKRRAIDDGIDIVDNEIEKAAQRNNVTFADVRSQFSGHELCGDGDEWLSGAGLIKPNPYHPTLTGYSNAYLPALTAAAAAVGQ